MIRWESLNLECRLPMSTRSLFKWRQFLPESILLNVRWYCRYGLSYRDLEQMMVERGIEVDHATSNRWVLKYAAELDKRIRPHLRPMSNSWRVYETYINVKGQMKLRLAANGYRTHLVRHPSKLGLSRSWRRSSVLLVETVTRNSFTFLSLGKPRILIGLPWCKSSAFQTSSSTR